jgi:hypothetical protein
LLLYDTSKLSRDVVLTLQKGFIKIEKQSKNIFLGFRVTIVFNDLLYVWYLYLFLELTDDGVCLTPGCVVAGKTFI